MKRSKMSNPASFPYYNRDVENKFSMDTSSLDRLIKEIGEKYACLRVLEVENELLREQNDALIKQNLMMKRVMEEKGII